MAATALAVATPAATKVMAAIKRFNFMPCS